MVKKASLAKPAADQVLLDTEAFIWAVMDPERLSRLARTVCESPSYSLWISPATLAEILIKSGRGKLPAEMTAAWFHKHAGYLQAKQVQIGMRHVERSFLLPAIHKDPFDRLLIATAIEEGYALLTSDRTIHQYPNTPAIW